MNHIKNIFFFYSGQTSKTVKKIIIGGKANMRTPDSLIKTPTSNLARYNTSFII